MPANIATVAGENAIAYIDATPWHGMGPNILALMQAATPAERIDVALKAAHLDYTVGSLPLYLADGTQITSHKASVRFNLDGTVAAQLGIVGKDYTHTQNARNVDILRPLAEEFGCVPACTAALGNGERAFMLMRMADATVSPLPGDDVRGYFLLHWGHDGNLSVQGLATGIRVVCQNTLSMATNGRKAWFSVRHTSSADARLDDAAKLMKRLVADLQATGKTFADMARTAITAEQLDKFIAAAIPNTDPSKATLSPVIVARRDTVARLVFLGRGAALANQAVDTTNGGASVWAAYNAITEYVDHVRTAEAQSPEGLRRAQESAVFGGNMELKSAAFQLARQLVAA
jgi:phage/plasmid-like protein (TIGR03299 family)